MKLRVAINLKPTPSPWGGGNQFAQQLSDYLISQGHEVVYKLDSNITAILIIDSKMSGPLFTIHEIKKFKSKRPQIPCIHRINECDKRKASHFIDKVLSETNEVADVTVFISNWLKDYFSSRWFDTNRPHCVIQNAADSTIFYPDKVMHYSDSEELRIVTHHWSDNWMKGFQVYRQVDAMIASHELEGFKLTVIGRWPKEIDWKTAELHVPCNGKALADKLRMNHLYLTASLWEPCGMHHIEGAQCGLPLVYHVDGGGIVEYGKMYGIGFQDDVKKALLDARNNYHELRKKVLTSAPSGINMCQQFEELFIRLNRTS